MDIHEEAYRLFGISYLMPFQELVVRRILENSEREEQTGALTILPTGAGKSLIFMLPACLMKNRYTILCYPLLALMHDQERRFRENGFEAVLLSGEADRKERRIGLDRLGRMECNVLITNPEMLAILTDTGRLGFMAGRLELLVFDEAHTIVDWGESFRPALLETPRLSRLLEAHQTMLFTATMDAGLERRTLEMFFDRVTPDVIRASADRQNIYYRAVTTLNRFADMIELLEPEERRPAVVFCAYRAETEYMKRRASSHFVCYNYHAGLAKEVKKETESKFFSSRNGVLFATNAYGLGVDKKDIRTAIHLHVPSDALSFLQESGRAGRDGKIAESFVLVSPSDKGALAEIFTKGGCIRTDLLRLLGEAREENGCELCDGCLKTGKTSVGRKEILCTVKRMPLVFTKSSLALYLSTSKRTTRTFRNYTRKETEAAISALLELGDLRTFLGRLVPAEKKRSQGKAGMHFLFSFLLLQVII